MRDTFRRASRRREVQLDADVVGIAKEHLRHAGALDHPAGELDAVLLERRQGLRDAALSYLLHLPVCQRCRWLDVTIHY
jgi:hypothetical protein